jgi:hypothetical protein
LYLHDIVGLALHVAFQVRSGADALLAARVTVSLNRPTTFRT